MQMPRSSIHSLAGLGETFLFMDGLTFSISLSPTLSPYHYFVEFLFTRVGLECYKSFSLRCGGTDTTACYFNVPFHISQEGIESGCWKSLYAQGCITSSRNLLSLSSFLTKRETNATLCLHEWAKFGTLYFANNTTPNLPETNTCLRASLPSEFLLSHPTTPRRTPPFLKEDFLHLGMHFACANGKRISCLLRINKCLPGTLIREVIRIWINEAIRLQYL
ncbi:hypothetical protein CDAR_59461 [Caerostris darwini]|uniref:Maturase K n=1 Tax=Caerostris darwini TaxID=1538125 RepID=A0AAV4X377_9ARAC|nr:hypothetical protein CDAR_59461 [Caerostris darwini]